MSKSIHVDKHQIKIFLINFFAREYPKCGSVISIAASMRLPFLSPIFNSCTFSMRFLLNFQCSFPNAMELSSRTGQSTIKRSAHDPDPVSRVRTHAHTHAARSKLFDGRIPTNTFQIDFYAKTKTCLSFRSPACTHHSYCCLQKFPLAAFFRTFPNKLHFRLAASRIHSRRFRQFPSTNF